MRRAQGKRSWAKRSLLMLCCGWCVVVGNDTQRAVRLKQQLARKQFLMTAGAPPPLTTLSRHVDKSRSRTESRVWGRALQSRLGSMVQGERHNNTGGACVRARVL